MIMPYEVIRIPDRSHSSGDEEGEPENGSKTKVKCSPSKTRGGGDGAKEELLDKPPRKGRSKEIEKKEQEQVEEEDDEEEDEDSDENELLIAENENDKDSSDDSDQDSDNSEDLDQPVHNGTMTRRQASQLKEGGGDAAVKKKNRTCDYCGVVKATPAALVRHLRKHTGERPFVCALCGKAYKAKRSLNLHENTVHKGLAKNPLPTQVPLESAAGVSLAPGDTSKQVCGTPPISESTKSLLRETLESSRKARDASASSTTITTTTAASSVSSDNTPATSLSITSNSSTPTTLTTSAAITTTTSSDKASERLSAPNLVNLLTSDLSKKMEQILAASGAATPLSLPLSSPATTSAAVLSIPNSKIGTAQGPSHNSLKEVTDIKREERPEEEEEEEEEGDVTMEEEEDEEEMEEQAEDLRIHPKQEQGEKKEKEDIDKARTVSAGHVRCEFCPEAFNNESCKAKHVLAAHNIILNLSHHSNNPTTLVKIEPKFGSLSVSLPPTLTPTKNKSSHHQQHKHKQLSSSLGESFTKVEAKPTVRVSPQTWTGIVPTVAGTTLSASDPTIATFPSHLSKPIRDLQATSLLSPSAVSSSSSSSLSSSAHFGDSMAMMENGSLVPMLSATLGAGTDGAGNGPGPMEENNALPYYITSRMLQDFNLDEVTLPDCDKSVVAEDGGHRRSRMTVMKETVLATRLDGINNITGRLATVYKCHLCKRVFSSLVRYNNHMPTHADIEITTYDCRYCEASFRSHIQIVKHLQCHREKFAGFHPIPLEDVAQSVKKKSDLLQVSDGNSPVPIPLTNNVSNILHSSGGSTGCVSLIRVPSYSEENGELLPLSSHEPGERKNGGYSCPKCRKNFTREYLLQRHMRIHRNQSSFYCPECESGFSGELDLMEHKMKVHGLKSAEDQQKYKTLVRMNPFKQFAKLNDTNNNNNIGLGVGGDSGSVMSSATKALGVDKMMPNARTASGDNGVGGGIFPVVDLKGIDLRLGEEVNVRMMGGLDDREKEEWMNQMRSEEYKKVFMSKFREIQTLFAGGHNGMAAGAQSWMRQADDKMKWRMMERERRVCGDKEEGVMEREVRVHGDKEEGGRRMMEKAKLKQELKEEKLREENERKRKLEQAQLKAKLMQQGMGDVIVVLPDAPSPDENGLKKDTPLDPEPASQSSANLNEMITSEEGLNLSSCIEKRREGLDQDVIKIDVTLSNDEDVRMEERKIKPMKEGMKRLSPDNGNVYGLPPAKSRRKALKPQKINHFEEEDTVEKESSASLSLSGSMSGNNNRVSGSDKAENANKETSKAKSKPNPDTSANSIGESTLSQWKQLVALGGAQVFSASDATAQLMTTPLNTALARTLSSTYSTNKLLPGFDSSGIPILFNNNVTNNNMNSAAEGGCDNEAMDLSTSTTDRGKSKSQGPQLSSTPKPPSKTGLSSSSACSPITSLSSSPVVMSYDIDAAAKIADLHKKSAQKIRSFSRSVSQEHDSDHSRSSDYVNRNLLSEGLRKNNNNNNQLNLQLPLNSAQFTNALLSGASGMNPETAALVGVPHAFWSAQSLAAAKSKAVGKVTNGNGSVGLICGGNSNSSSSSKSRTSSPSPVPSPTGIGESSTSNDGRKVTSLSRTHSRLSVVNEPLDRNTLCKPKMTEDGRSVYSCTICHKNFLSLSDINRHMDFHEDIRPFKCKYCDYYARTNSQLKVHKLRHEGVREFCCRVCNYKGVTQSDLNRHTKSQVHLLRSNHVCQNCGEGFVTPKALRDHITNSCTGNRQDSSFERSYEKDDMEEDEEEDDGYDVKDELEEREVPVMAGMDMRLVVG